MKLEVAGIVPERSRLLWTTGVFAILLLTTLLVAYSHATFGVSTSWTGENGLLETTQQLLLAIAGVGFAASAQFKRNQRTSPVRSLVFAAFCVSFLLRETDVAAAGEASWLSFWLDESGRDLLLVTTWVCVGLFALSHTPLWSMLRNNTVFDTTTWMLVVGVFLMACSWAIDRKHIIISNPQAIEETFEVFAYGVMCAAGLMLHIRRADRVDDLPQTIPMYPDNSTDPPSPPREGRRMSA